MTTLQRSAEILTVGLPFCVFKLLGGLVALGVPHGAPLGYALIALGAIDAVLNLVNLGALATVHRGVGSVCLAQLALRRRSTELGLAIDVFFSFALVAAFVGLGLLARLPAWALPIWNVAVVLNVLGAGIGRLSSALGRLAHSE